MRFTHFTLPQRAQLHTKYRKSRGKKKLLHEHSLSPSIDQPENTHETVTLCGLYKNICIKMYLENTNYWSTRIKYLHDQCYHFLYLYSKPNLNLFSCLVWKPFILVGHTRLNLKTTFIIMVRLWNTCEVFFFLHLVRIQLILNSTFQLKSKSAISMHGEPL